MGEVGWNMTSWKFEIEDCKLKIALCNLNMGYVGLNMT